MCRVPVVSKERRSLFWREQGPPEISLLPDVCPNQQAERSRKLTNQNFRRRALRQALQTAAIPFKPP
jgi:hypothetical protein